MGKILIGLDIGSQTIKAVQISREKKTVSLLAAGYIPTPQKSLSLIGQKEEQILASSINQLIHDMKVSTTNVSASLPSAKVVTQIVHVPLMSEDELEKSISWEAEQYIPWPLQKVKLDCIIIDKNLEDKKMKVQLVAAQTDFIEQYMRIISMAGMNLVSLETGILAEVRSSAFSFPELGNAIIVSIGATGTDIGLLHEHILIYNKSYPIGGNTLTSVIAQDLGFESLQAEEYKKTYGLEEDKLEGKIAQIIKPFMVNIYGEIEKTIVYFKEQYPKEEINNIILTGGGAKLPGLILATTKYLGLNSQIANPFVNLAVDSKVLPLLSDDAPMYANSVGLALKETS